jgi:8-oxo-dGTP pyrophosphatase MutT (NUDIX family)
MTDVKAEEPFDPTTVPVKPAATVLLIRDADDSGIEVFMLRRTFSAAFASGMFVFPGGKVDDVDGMEDIAEICDGLTDEHASSLLGLPNGGLAYWVACIRECFEEAGVLLARHETTGDVVRFDAPEVIERFNTERHNIHDGSIALLDLCAQEGLRLTTDDIHYVSHWITPVGEKRRFDTRFFIARAQLHKNHCMMMVKLLKVSGLSLKKQSVVHTRKISCLCRQQKQTLSSCYLTKPPMK